MSNEGRWHWAEQLVDSYPCCCDNGRHTTELSIGASELNDLESTVTQLRGELEVAREQLAAYQFKWTTRQRWVLVLLMFREVFLHPLRKPIFTAQPDGKTVKVSYE